LYILLLWHWVWQIFDDVLKYELLHDVDSYNDSKIVDIYVCEVITNWLIEKVDILYGLDGDIYDKILRVIGVCIDYLLKDILLMPKKFNKLLLLIVNWWFISKDKDI